MAFEEDLMNLIMPSGEAEAASPRSSGPSMPSGFDAGKFAQSMMMKQVAETLASQRDQLKQKTREADPMYQEKLKAAQAKNAPAPSVKDIMGQGGIQHDPQSEMPISFGRDPNTGVWSFNNRGYADFPEDIQGQQELPEWARDPKIRQIAEQYSSPEVQKQIDQHKQIQSAKLPVTPPIPGLDANPTVAGAMAAGQVPPPTPDQLDAHSRIAENLQKHHGYTKERADAAADSQVPAVPQWTLAQDLKKKGMEARERRREGPAKPGTYLDAEGNYTEARFTNEGEAMDFVKAGGRRLEKGSPEEKVFGSGDLMKNHLNETINHVLPYLLRTGLEGNALKKFLQSKVADFQNDPDLRVLTDFLGPASATALNALYTSMQQSGMRGGMGMINMFHNAFYGPKDNLDSFLTKVGSAANLMRQGLLDKKLPTKDADKILETVNSLKAGKIPGQEKEQLDALPKDAIDTGKKKNGKAIMFSPSKQKHFVEN